MQVWCQHWGHFPCENNGLCILRDKLPGTGLAHLAFVISRSRQREIAQPVGRGRLYAHGESPQNTPFPAGFPRKHAAVSRRGVRAGPKCAC